MESMSLIESFENETSRSAGGIHLPEVAIKTLNPVPLLPAKQQKYFYTTPDATIGISSNGLFDTCWKQSTQTTLNTVAPTVWVPRQRTSTYRTLCSETWHRLCSRMPRSLNTGTSHLHSLSHTSKRGTLHSTCDLRMTGRAPLFSSRSETRPCTMPGPRWRSCAGTGPAQCTRARSGRWMQTRLGRV